MGAAARLLVKINEYLDADYKSIDEIPRQVLVNLIAVLIYAIEIGDGEK